METNQNTSNLLSTLIMSENTVEVVCGDDESPKKFRKYPLRDDIEEIYSNLPLQMCLYINVLLVPVWMFTKIIFLVYRDLYKMIIVTVVTGVSVIECLRLYFGYDGNLKDKIPQLAGFWMLSVMLQLPMQSFLLFDKIFQSNNLQTIFQSLMFAILCIEIIFGFCALKFTVAKQAEKFKQVKLTSGLSLFEDDHEVCYLH